MKNLFKLTFSCLMIVLTNSLSAQTWTNPEWADPELISLRDQMWTNESEIDFRCARRMQEIFLDRSYFSPKGMYLNTEAAKTINGEMYEGEPIIIKATPKQYDKARLIITQEGTWFKGIIFSPIKITEPEVIVLLLNSYLSACAMDEFKTGSVYLSDAKRMERITLIESEFLGYIEFVYDVLDFKELDDNYDWTIVWNK